MKAVAVYLKLKEQFVKFHPEIMPCACCWKSQSFLEIATFNFFGDVFGWDFKMEPWKDSCCSSREASAELGGQD